LRITEEPVTFKSGGMQVMGVLHIPEDGRKAAIAMCHGFTGEKVEAHRLFVDFARAASRRNYAVLRFDFIGSGDSEGEFEDTTLSGWIRDLDAAVTFLAANLYVDPSRIGVLGLSFGAAAAICHAASDSRVRAVACWSPVSDLIEIFRRYIFGEELWSKAEAGETIQYFYESSFKLKPNFLRDLKTFNPIADVARISPRPLLVVQGTRDEVVPVSYTEKLTGSASEPKELVKIEGADHVFSRHSDILLNRTLDWFQRFL